MSSPQSGPPYYGTQVIARPLFLELAQTPDSWTGESPDKHGIQVLQFPIWVGGAADVPTFKALDAFIHQKFDPVSHPQRKTSLRRRASIAYSYIEFRVSTIYWWDSRQGRNPLTGAMEEKNIKHVVSSDSDLAATLCAFARIPNDTALELFFQLILQPHNNTNLNPHPNKASTPS